MVNIYSEKEIEIMREGGKILAKILKTLSKKVKSGITTAYLNKVAEDLIFSFGAKPSFRGFNGYPAALCTSVNEEIVHAVPSKKILKNGDILTLDLGIKFKGFCTDAAITVPVGKIDKKVRKLITTTKKSLEIAIKQAKPGNYLEDIGWAIQNYVEKRGFNVIRELVGHGVGKQVHEDPQILNYGRKEQGVVLKEGMVLALEPMVAIGNWRIKRGEDRFGYKTLDNSLSAHFEHTIAITKRGPKILTKV
ncbi:MAG: type I methionyl aminopeptidase [bacterium]|nr:type I methionyl aminopeptidase [bacterium]